MSDNLTCAVDVRRGDDWHGRREPCGKKAKGKRADGTPACGTHLNVEKRQSDGQRQRAAFEGRKQQVAEQLGIKLWGWEVREPQVVEVYLTDLEELAERVPPAVPPAVVPVGTSDETDTNKDQP